MTEIWSLHFLSYATIPIFELFTMLAEFKFCKVHTKCVLKKFEEFESLSPQQYILYPANLKQWTP